MHPYLKHLHRLHTQLLLSPVGGCISTCSSAFAILTQPMSLNLQEVCAFVLPHLCLLYSHFHLSLGGVCIPSPSMVSILSPPLVSLSLASECLVLPPLYIHTQTFLVSRKWVPCPPSMIYMIRLPFVSLSLASG